MNKEGKLIYNSNDEDKINVRKHRTINFVNSDKRRNYLVPGPNYHST